MCASAQTREEMWLDYCVRANFYSSSSRVASPFKKTCRHPPPIDGRTAREGERIAGKHFTMPPNIDLRLSPLTVALYEILDVLVAIGFDLARSKMNVVASSR